MAVLELYRTILNGADREKIAGMGLVSRAYDKLPDWAKILLGICAIAAIVYGLATEGPIFLLKVLLKPVP